MCFDLRHSLHLLKDLFENIGPNVRYFSMYSTFLSALGTIKFDFDRLRIYIGFTTDLGVLYHRRLRASEKGLAV